MRTELHAIKTAYTKFCESLSAEQKEINLEKVAISVIIIQKRHHIRLFRKKEPEKVPEEANIKIEDQNVPPGTLVDSQIIHPVNMDFLLVSHKTNQVKR